MSIMEFRVCRHGREARWVVTLGNSVYGAYLDKEQALLDAVDAARDALASRPRSAGLGRATALPRVAYLLNVAVLPTASSGRCTARAAGTASSVERGEHVGGDQGDAAVAAVKALGVEFRVLADDEPFRNAAAAVDHHLVEPRVAADLDLGQQHRLAGLGIGIDPARWKTAASARPCAPDTMQPPDTIESTAMPRRSSSSKTNFAGGNCC